MKFIDFKIFRLLILAPCRPIDRVWCLLFLVGAERVSIEGGRRIEAVAESLIHITCHASPSRPPVNVTWNSSLQDEATVIQNEAAGSVWTNSTVLADKKRYIVTSILMIRVNRSDNGRVYQCSAINVAMTTPVSATTQLTVHCKCIFNLSINQSISCIFHNLKYFLFCIVEVCSLRWTKLATVQPFIAP